MLKYFTSDLRRNIIKIFCLSTGLAIGLLLVAKVYFDIAFDTSLPDVERIYIATESAEQMGEYKEYRHTPGAIAPGLKRYVPQVEAATRITYSIFSDTKFATPDGRKFLVSSVRLADSCFFDVIKPGIIQGDPHEALAVEWKCMIPESLAKKIGSDVMGMRIVSSDIGENRELEIAGVYRDFPLNSSFDNGIIVSLATIPHITYDGREGWIGNDVYSSYVRINKNSTPDDTKPHISKMLTENIPEEILTEGKFNIGLTPLAGNHTSNPGVRSMNRMLSMLAIIILIGSSLNYLLVVIAQMQWRSKEMAIRKCYGTDNRHIFSMVIGENLLFMFISLAIAAVIVASLSSECEQLLGVKASVLLSSWKVWLIEISVCLALLCVTGVIPAWLYCKTPVSSAFRKNAHGKRLWKLSLLALEFAASVFLFCLLVLIGRQYCHISNADVGYDCDNLAMADIHRVPEEERLKLVEELRKLGNVEGVASAHQDFTSYAAGNSIYPRDDYMKQVNIADMYYANPGIFKVMGMDFIQGGPFEAFAGSNSHQVVVEKGFIDDIRKIQNFEGNHIVGRDFLITGHIDENGNNEFEVKGVIGDIRKNGFNIDDADLRSGVIFPTTDICRNLYVRFNNMTPAALEEARKVIDTLFPEEEIVLMPVKSRLDAINSPVLRFGMSVMISGIVIILITLTGLVGYAADEVNRRAKEIAIRKVNGMSVNRILRMFCTDILKIAVPAMIAGFAAALIVGKEWISQFTDQTSLSPLSMLAAVFIILLIVILVVTACCFGVVRANPVKYLREE